METLPGHPIEISIPAEKIGKPVSHMLLNVDTSYFEFTQQQLSGFTIEFPSPTSTGLHSAAVVIQYQDNTVDRLDFLLNVREPGLVFSAGTLAALPDSIVTLYELKEGGWRVFDGRSYHQSNPERTDEQGRYAFLAPPGTYYLAVEQPGFAIATTNRFEIATVVVATDIDMIPKPPPLTLDSSLPVNLGKTGVFAGRVIRKEIEKAIQNPVVEKTNESIVAPAVVTGAVVNVAIAIPGFQMLPFLQYIFTSPAWFWHRRRREKWGAVYNSLTKLPVDLATVRLVNIGSGQVVATRVTDMLGRYALIAPEGEFRIEIHKPGFIFPSTYLEGKKEDLDYVDLYQGQLIKAKRGAIITANIPMDPEERVPVPEEVLRKYWKQRFHFAFSLLGTILAVISFIISPHAIIAGFLGLHIITFLLFRRLASPRRPKSWGIVYDIRTKKPLPHAVVRIFETQFNKLLDSWATDRHGRYSFLVGSNVYFVTSERTGYHKYISSKLDLRKQPDVVVQDIPMKPGAATS